MEQIIIIGGFILLFCILLIQIYSSFFKKNTESNNESLLFQNSIENKLEQQQELSRTFQNQLLNIESNIRNKIDDNNKTISYSFQSQAREQLDVIKNITEHLTKLDNTNKQVISFAEELQNLQNILKNPKQRGILGEYFLETTLKNVLPPDSYKMQYMFSNGEIVDAAVFVKDKIIPIDSKFSLENYNRLSAEENPVLKKQYEKVFLDDLKLRITETAKYIRPEEGTMDFAFMFIPHEAIYYDLLINKIGAINEDTENLLERAANKYKVLIVSPTSFLAYLQTVMQGLRALQIEESAKEIQKRVSELGKHLSVYEDYHAKIGTTLSTVVNHYNKSRSELLKIDKDVYRITGEKIERENLLVEKPNDKMDFE